MGAFFLEINGFEAIVDRFIIEMENIAVTVADDIIEKKLLQEIIASIIYEPDYSEELKLQILIALSKVNPENELLDKGVDFYKDLY